MEALPHQRGIVAIVTQKPVVNAPSSERLKMNHVVTIFVSRDDLIP